MYGLFLPALVAGLVLWALFILLHAALKSEKRVNVEIIIDACGAEDIEGLVINAKNAAQKYFDNASIYIRGGDEEYCEVLCKAYDIQKI